MNNDKVTSRTFFNEWVDTVKNRKEHLLEIWSKHTEFTKAVISNDNSIMKEIAKNLDLNCYDADYYDIDTILYHDDDLVEDRPENTFWFRDIRVAFEHENHFNSGLYQEVSHLLLLNCDLRVLVTYGPVTDEWQEKLDAELESLHKVIEGNRQSKAISDNESFLIIFGWINDFTWWGYIYKENGWEKINYAA